MEFARLALLAVIGLSGCGVHAKDAQPSPRSASSDPTGTSSPSDPGDAPADAGGTPTNVDENLARLRGLGLFEVGDLVLGPRAVERLAILADRAEEAVATPYGGYACGARIDVNLEALRSLEIVGVGSFLRSFPEDDAKDEASAAQLESVALAAQGI